jgi:hypothetical protein
MPALSPSFSIQFARAKRIPTNLTFSRADTVAAATYVNDKGLVSLAGPNEPRFNHDPISRACLGLMAENSRANLCIYSNTMTSWYYEGMNAPSSVTSPSGASDATLFTNSGITTSLISQTVTVTASSTNDYFASMFVKPYASSYVTLNTYYNGNGEDNVDFTFSTMSISNAPYPNDVIFEKYPGGWYRIGYRISRDGTGTRTTIFHRLWQSGRAVTSGSAAVWGGQVEPGTYPTSLIVTEATAVTRPAEIISLAGTAFSSWYNQVEGTIAVYGNRNLKATGPGMAFSISQNATNSHRGYIDSSTNIVVDTSSAGVNQQAITFTGAVKSGAFSVVSAHKTNDFATCANESALQTDTSGTLPAAMTTLWIGSDQGTNYFLDGCIHSIVYYNTRLSNSYITSLAKAKEYMKLIEPGFTFNFIRNQGLPPSVFYSRNDIVGTYYGSDGFIKTALPNQPRFDYEPVSKTIRGLLLEDASSNLALYSEEFANAVWVWNGGTGTKTDNTVTSPYGTVTASTLTNTSALSFQQSVTMPGTALATVSIYLKAGTVTTITLAQWRTGDTAQSSTVSVDLSTGSITGGDGTVEPIGSGWYRVSCPYIGTISANTTCKLEVYMGAGTLYAFGGQIEQNYSVATSYIKTTSAAVTRVAETLSATDDSFNKWFNQAEGTVAVSATRRQTTVTSSWPALVSIHDATNNERYNMYYEVGSSSMKVWVDDNGVNQWYSPGQAINTDVPFVQVFSYSSTDFKTSFNDKPTEVDSSNTLPTPTFFRIGSNISGSQLWAGHIRWLMYYPYNMPAETHRVLINQ